MVGLDRPTCFLFAVGFGFRQNRWVASISTSRPESKTRHACSSALSAGCFKPPPSSKTPNISSSCPSPPPQLPHLATTNHNITTLASYSGITALRRASVASSPTALMCSQRSFSVSSASASATTRQNASLSAIGGIDYAMHCPAVCVWLGDNPERSKDDKKASFGFEQCRFFFLSPVTKYCGAWLDGCVVGEKHTPFHSQQHRFRQIALSTVSFLEKHRVVSVGLEGYAYKTRAGRIFEIGENTGALKFALEDHHIRFSEYAPTSVKKLGCGYGFGAKEDMIEAFEKETGINLRDVFKISKSQKGLHPIEDLVDAFYICKLHWEKMRADA